MVPQKVILSTSSSVPASPSMFQHQKTNSNKKGRGSFDDSSIINDNVDLNQQQGHRRYSFSRSSLRDMSNNNKSLGYSDDDNNLIDLTSEKPLQISNEISYSYPAHQQEVSDESQHENGKTKIKIKKCVYLIYYYYY